MWSGEVDSVPVRVVHTIGIFGEII